MTALNAFGDYLKTKKGATATAGPAQGDQASAGDQAAPAPPAGPKPDAKRDLQDSVNKRLDALYGPYKLAVEQGGPEGQRLSALWQSLRAALDADDDEKASKILDEIEPFAVVLAKKTLVEKKVADLEKLPHADQFKQDIADIRAKIADAMKLAAAPGNDFKGAVVAMKQVEATFANIQDLDKQSQRYLNVKADTDTKVARLDKNPQSKSIAADLAKIKQEQAAAIALATPPKHDYQQAIKALAAVDQHCAAAEVTMLDAMTTSMRAGGGNRAALEAYLKHTFKERFDVNLELDDKGDTPEQVYTAVKKIYELMAEVPESHTNKNPSLHEVKRIGGPEGKGDDTWYQPGAHFIIRWAGDKMNIHAGYPDHPQTDTSQQGLINPATGKTDPPVDPECEPTNSDDHNRFNWGTLHEIGHAADERQGFMKQSKNLAYGGWTDYGTDCTQAAKAAAAHFAVPGDDVVKYIKKLLEGKKGERPKHRPDTPQGLTDAKFGTSMTDVENWCDAIHDTENPWDNTTLPEFAGGLIYHESYKGHWVSYKRSARSQAISGYQFRAPAEWFAELYAAYHSGILKDAHPMVKNFLLDM
jgi:hypothetical protein